MRPIIAACLALVGSACHVGHDFRGPGVHAGQLREDVPSTLVVAVTEGEIRPGESEAMFAQLEQVMDSLATRDGLVGYMVRKQALGQRIWTMSAWVDDESLNRFLSSSEHRQAERDGGIPRNRVRSARVRLPSSDLPLTWSQAIALLQDE